MAIEACRILDRHPHAVGSDAEVDAAVPAYSAEWEMDDDAAAFVVAVSFDPGFGVFVFFLGLAVFSLC